MEDKIKDIISVFIKVPAGNIGPATAVDRSAVQNSILLHRMYARLAEEGFVFENYSAIRVFGDLLPAAGAGTVAVVTAADTDPADFPEPSEIRVAPISPIMPPTRDSAPEPDSGRPEIGIDIEAIGALPVTTDFRKTEFYRMNFSAGEIAYCILQPDPYASFAGLFAAKEAIVKADGQSRNRPFNTLCIGHSTDGKPLYPGFTLSISHAGEMAVAVAVRTDGMSWRQTPAALLPVPPIHEKKSNRIAPIAWLALLLALAALVVTLSH